MDAKIPMGLIRDSHIKPQAKLIYGLIATYRRYDDPNEPIVVDQKQMAQDLNLTTVQIRFWVRELEKSGWMIKKKTGKHHEYILICLPGEEAEKEQEPSGAYK
ncbi:MAG: helix-turn-helix domain-containing protein [Candidatus Aminicenantes bacterium]|nr:helix-turn-helix domain-containing protein [Candidatus Aminicenantes bacterium]MDH5384667.1 helix-turn-helix domain-containing protein [Candidatus Aminicenantes bacterium]MDH5743041.1 helix-turn-helix domain-containing protein [Candidatus Aminicenantes bacterium]